MHQSLLSCKPIFWTPFHCRLNKAYHLFSLFSLFAISNSFFYREQRFIIITKIKFIGSLTFIQKTLWRASQSLLDHRYLLTLASCWE